MGSAAPSSFFRGRLAYAQPARGAGFRGGDDGLILAFEALRQGARGAIADLGAGAGLVGLAVALHEPGARVTLVERDADAARCAVENARPFGDRVDVSVLDVADLGGAHEWVLSNPPYREPDEGSATAAASLRAARTGALEPFVAAAARVLGPEGRALFVFPSRGLPLLTEAAARAGLGVAALRFVHRENRPARLVLATFAGHPTETLVLPPLLEDVDVDWRTFVSG